MDDTGREIEMSVLRCHSEMDERVQDRARRVLRRELRHNKNVLTDDGAADCVIEQVWNALVGFLPAADQ